MLVKAYRRLLLAAAAALLPLTIIPAAAQPIDTAAKQALLVDFHTGTVLLEKNADELMPPSSMSKLMTTYMVFDEIEKGRLKLDDLLPVSEKAWRKQGSKMFVHVGDRASVEDLLKGVIVQSGNDACIVLAEGIAGSEEAFADEMTRRARELGLTASVFKNSTGWPEEGHVMTARDLAVLAERIILDHPEYYRYYAITEFTYNNIKQGNRNPLLYKNMGADGLKTGHTEAAGYGLTASATRGDRRLILVVNGLTSMKQRSEESERLLEWGFREFDNYVLFNKGETVAEADTWLGAPERLPLVAGERMYITLPRNLRGNVSIKAVWNGPIAAPVQRGDEVAKLIIEVPGRAPQEMPLLAGADVEKLGFFGKISAAVRYILLGAGSNASASEGT